MEGRDTLPVIQSLNDKRSVPCLPSGASLHCLWIAVLQHGCGMEKGRPILFLTGSGCMWAREQKAKMPAALLVLLWDLLQ